MGKELQRVSLILKSGGIRWARTEPSMITTPRYSKPVMRFMIMSAKKKHTTNTTHVKGTCTSKSDAKNDACHRNRQQLRVWNAT